MLTEAESVTEAISLPEQLSFVDGSLTVQLDPSLAAVLRARGITSLYSHQATAWEHSRIRSMLG